MPIYVLHRTCTKCGAVILVGLPDECPFCDDPESRETRRAKPYTSDPAEVEHELVGTDDLQPDNDLPPARVRSKEDR
jgi:hypothetical protein